MIAYHLGYWCLFQVDNRTAFTLARVSAGGGRSFITWQDKVNYLERVFTMVKSISSVVAAFAKVNDSSESMINKQLQRISHAFIDMSINLVDGLQESLTEDETLAEPRKQYNQALIDCMLKGSNYGFSNVLKIGNIAKKNKAWLLGFQSLSALCVGLAAFSSVPSCKGIGALEIITADKNKTVDDMVKGINNSLPVDQIRSAVNEVKGIPSKAKIESTDKVESLVKNESTIQPIADNAVEKSALYLAKALNANRDNKEFLLAFSVSCFNLGCIDKVLNALNEQAKNGRYKFNS